MQLHAYFCSGVTFFELYHHCKPNLSHLQVWECQYFIIILPELRTKGGSRHYEATFVGYDDNHIRWYVHDLKGNFHFSCNIIFNKLTPGHLSSSSRHDHPSTMSYTTIDQPLDMKVVGPHPVCTCVRTAAGQAFADTIPAHNAHLCLCSPDTDKVPALFSLAVILDFVLLNAHPRATIRHELLCNEPMLT